MSFWRYSLTLLLSASCLPIAAAEQTFQSGPEQTVLMELYTSEGCNSCPPAESFLNSFTDHPRLWQSYIPLAFHVDYWDYLGWRDVYATAANTRRQQTYGKVLRARTIYTPEFFVNGQEWRAGFLQRPPSIKSKAVGTLKVVLNDEAITAEFTPQRRYQQPLELYAVVLGMDLKSDIRAGENAGRTTTHQFVVLGHAQLKNDKPQWQTTVPALIDVPASKKALVVWVSETGNPAPLQATGGYIAR